MIENVANDASTDVEARMAQIVGGPPRIGPLDREQLSEAQVELIGALRSSAGAAIGDVPEYFLITVKHPALFRGQMEMAKVLFTGTIPARERELAVLRVGWLCQAPYEWGEHVDIAKRHGVTPDEVERVVQGSSAPGWGEHDAAILRGVEELLADYAISDETWHVLAQGWSEQQLLEFPMLVGAYVGTAMQQNALRMRLAGDNPGLSHR
jgi:4-carboxymuconolactone decarboxylase